MADSTTRLDILFCEAISIADSWARAAFLKEACGSDAELFRRVEVLVAAHFRAGSFLEEPLCAVETDAFAISPDTPLAASAASDVDATIGPYRLRGLLGQGGMGNVYVAEQTRPVRRKVALKVIKLGMDTREVISRFEAERQALALMDHPNIAKVLDAGTTENGRPYFVMELVKGQPITEHSNVHKLGTRARLELFLQVCQAVQHAHQKAIIHRDLKPSNVLVAMHDTKPVVKVIDFGVAKAIGQQLTDQTLYTACSHLIGTPLYMSPEQAGLSSLDVDTRSDVYSLGVLLYELLTGKTPFEGQRLREAGYDEMRRLIREEEPPRPSVRVMTLRATCPPTCPHCLGQPRDLVRTLRGELDCIMMKALEKDRTRRYESAGALAADVQRYLNHEPILARPTTVVRRFGKWLRRHPAAALALLVSHICGLLVVLTAVWHFYEMSAALSVSDELRAELQTRTSGLRLQLYATELQLAWQAWTEGDIPGVREMLDHHRPKQGDADLRGFEWHFLHRLVSNEPRTLTGHEALLLAADVSSDDRWIASGDRGGTVKIWDLATGREGKTLSYGDKEVTSVRFSPDGRTLATAGQDRTIHLWDVATWTETACLRGHTMTICCVAWSPDGKWLASAGRDNAVKIWDGTKRQEIRTLVGHSDVVRCVAWSPDGKLLASGGRDEMLRFWDTQTWAESGAVDNRHDTGLLAIAFNPQGTYLASVGYHSPVIVRDVASRAEVARLETLATCWSLAFSRDGNWLLAGGEDGRLSVWSISGWSQGAKLIRKGIGHAGTIRAVLFAAQDQTVVTASEQEQTLKVWSTASLVGRQKHQDDGTILAVSPVDGVAAKFDGSMNLRVVSYPAGSSEVPLRGHDAWIGRAAFSSNGRLLAAMWGTWQLGLWDLAAQPPRYQCLTSKQTVFSFALAPDGTWMAAINQEGIVSLWRVGNDSPAVVLQGTSHPATCVAISPDGTMLATGSNRAPDIDLWEAATGMRLGELRSTTPVASLAFSPDGTVLAAGGQVGRVSLMGVTQHRELAVLRGHDGEVPQVAFSPDGKTLATLGTDRTARLWHVPTRRPLCTLLHHPYALRWLVFASDRRLLVGAAPNGRDRGCNVVELDAGEPSAPTTAVDPRPNAGK